MGSLDPDLLIFGAFVHDLWSTSSLRLEGVGVRLVPPHLLPNQVLGAAFVYAAVCQWPLGKNRVCLTQLQIAKSVICQDPLNSAR